ncbi:LOW QUALITY PROTEIN: hypothetical protein Cgig2_005304 [Carnegiea gigantea]|uniref:Uncharacterized protein n=1 Tax=Carnegiea gigantea TaxID=171969 RepID=A0A9Q1QAS0_9CARY|nr:LOW QUALITY PROTEIN: hypothetical protein Cgig2_005304 [Carnegiea gigantea]
MADAITRQVTEQVKRVMEAQPGRSMARKPPTDRKGCRPFTPWSLAGRGCGQIEVSGLFLGGKQRRNSSLDLHEREQHSRRPPLPPTQRTSGELLGFGAGADFRAEERVLKHKGQIDRFLKRGPRFLRQEHEWAPPSPRVKECSTEAVATITGGYATDITRAAWKAKLRTAQQVLTVEQGSYIPAPTMVFGGKDTLRFASPHKDPLVVEMKIASAIVRRILFRRYHNLGLLEKAHALGRDIVPMTNPILGFGGQEVHPSATIRLPVHFGDKTRFKSLEVDFLVVDVPTAYNVIISRPTLHRVRVVVAPYLNKANTTILYNHVRDRKQKQA